MSAETSEPAFVDPLLSLSAHELAPLVRLAEGALEQITHRFITDMMNAATIRQWLTRARVFEDARPKPTDWPGRASAAEIAAQDARCAASAAACRLHAAMLRGDNLTSQGHVDDLVTYLNGRTPDQVQVPRGADAA